MRENKTGVHPNAIEHLALFSPQLGFNYTSQWGVRQEQRQEARSDEGTKKSTSLNSCTIGLGMQQCLRNKVSISNKKQYKLEWVQLELLHMSFPNAWLIQWQSQNTKKTAFTVTVDFLPDHGTRELKKLDISYLFPWLLLRYINPYAYQLLFTPKSAHSGAILQSISLNIVCQKWIWTFP